MAFTLDKIIFSPIITPISITHTVGFGSSLTRSYSVRNTDVNEVKINIRTPNGVHVDPSFIQLAPNQASTVLITADRTFFDTLPNGENTFNITFEFVGQGDPIDPTTDVIVYELQLTSTPSLTIAVNQTSAITAQVLEKNLTKQTQNIAMNRVITYTSSNPNIVSVGQLTGAATGISSGNAQITVSNQGAGSKIVLVGVYALPPSDRWWEKVVITTTAGQKFFAGPYTTHIEPYPIRETRNGILYDVYYSKIEEDRMNTTTYYYDWVDITDTVQNITDTEKTAQGFIASLTKPVAPSPQTVDGGIVRIVTNARFEERIVQVDIPPGPSATPVPPVSRQPLASPSPTPSAIRVPCPPTQIGTIISDTPLGNGNSWRCVWIDNPNGDGCVENCFEKVKPPIVPDYIPPSPSPSPIIVTPKQWIILLVEPLVQFHTIATTSGEGQYAVGTTVQIGFTQVDPAYTFVGWYTIGGVAEGDGQLISSLPNPLISVPQGGVTLVATFTPRIPPPASIPPDKVITFGVFGGSGTINGNARPFSIAAPLGSTITVDCVAGPGYIFEKALKKDINGVTSAVIVPSNFIIYVDQLTDEVQAYFIPSPLAPIPASPTIFVGGGGGGISGDSTNVVTALK